MRITPVTSALGAHVDEVDLATASDDEIAEIDAAWAEHGVLFFRDQHLTPEQHLDLAARFAPVDVNRYFTPVDGHPGIAEVRKEPDQVGNVGGGWHTDHSYDAEPARGSILLAREIPPSGGDTLFASTGAAFDALSPGLQDVVRQLRATHTNAHVFSAAGLAAQGTTGRISAAEPAHASHPVVVRHPVTGRELLYVNPAFTTGIEGWHPAESQALLDLLYSVIARAPHTVRFRWEVGSMAMWDNRSTWHWAVNDYQGHRRLMHRVTIRGQALAGSVGLQAA